MELKLVFLIVALELTKKTWDIFLLDFINQTKWISNITVELE